MISNAIFYLCESDPVVIFAIKKKKNSEKFLNLQDFKDNISNLINFTVHLVTANTFI